MGKSSNSCFKILTCGADAGAENDDGVPELDVEKNISSDKRRWSFRKRSSGHRVLSNNVTSEPLPIDSDKETQEATAINCYSPISSSIPEKTHTQETVIDNPSTLVDSGAADAKPAEVDTHVYDSTAAASAEIPESVAVIIQTAIRRYLSQEELRKLKHLVKLQAAVRGHLVRRQAVGALRCLHALVKLQMLVRVRHAQILAINSANVEIGKKEGKGTTSINQKIAYASRGLFLNAFARQLLESTPSTKPVSIKCDPSKEDAAWKWLERWMVVTPVNIKHLPDQNCLSQEEDPELRVSNVPNDKWDETVAAPAESNTFDTATTGESDLMPTTKYAPNAKSSLEKDTMKQSQVEVEASNLNQFDSEKLLEGSSGSLSVQISAQSDLTPESTLDVPAEKPDHVKSEQQSDKRLSSEPLESEGKTFAKGSRKASNPAYVAAQSKFEELSSGEVVGQPCKSSSRDLLARSKVDKLQNEVNPSSLTDEHKADSLSKSDNVKAVSSPKGDDRKFIDSQYPKSHVAPSECGTEISISSTLDSPDRSEAEAGEIVLEITSLEKEKYGTNGRTNIVSDHKVNSESIDGSLEQSTELQKVEHSNGEDASALVDSNSMQVEMQTSKNTSAPQVNIERVLDPEVDQSSPNISPRSHIIVPESRGTPVSQLSVNAKKTKTDLPARKKKSQLAPKRSPTNPSSDSGGRSSTEHLPNDSMTTRRRSFFGTKPDQVDHEPRNSSSSSLPSYMQATESARAKVNVSVSPKASPDVHDKDNYPKKRHSLPMANGTQGSSPRMQRSTSQAQQNLKGNGINSPQTSTERRWQR